MVEARFARRPLVPLRLFRLRVIFAGNTVMLLAGACLNPMRYLLTLYMQDVLHYGPPQAGAGFPAAHRGDGPRRLGFSPG